MVNILVLFSYGSLTTIDDVAGFYDDIFHGHATDKHIATGIARYESIGRADPLGAHTTRIGRALTQRLGQETGEEWRMFIANHHSEPSIEVVAQRCVQLNPKQVVTFGLTPFHSVTGNSAYEKKFRKIFRAKNNTTKLIHISPYCENHRFVETIIDRAQTAHQWLPATVRHDAEIIFTVHSMPGIAKVHEKLIGQYKKLAKTIATTLGIHSYHIAYRSGQPAPQRWLGPDVLDVVSELGKRNIPAVIFIEALSVIENMEVIQEISRDALKKARALGMKAVQSEYLNDSVDFVGALADHLLEELTI